MAGRLSRSASASSAHNAVGMPTTGMQPMANPRARVSARRRGEIPCSSHTAAFCFIESNDTRFVGDSFVIILTLSKQTTAGDYCHMKLVQTNQKRQWKMGD